MTALRGRALALEALRRIEADPESWDQRRWHCGAACCLAGHVALAAGYAWLVPEGDDDTMAGMDVVGETGGPRPVVEVAAESLGIHEFDADNLFSGSNNLDDLRYYIDRILPEEPQP